MRLTPVRKIAGVLIKCRECDEKTWAQGADSGTLVGWAVVVFPDEAYCPKCAKRKGMKAGHG